MFFDSRLWFFFCPSSSNKCRLSFDFISSKFCCQNLVSVSLVQQSKSQHRGLGCELYGSYMSLELVSWCKTIILNLMPNHWNRRRLSPWKGGDRQTVITDFKRSSSQIVLSIQFFYYQICNCTLPLHRYPSCHHRIDRWKKAVCPGQEQVWPPTNFFLF